MGIYDEIILNLENSELILTTQVIDNDVPIPSNNSKN